MKELLSLILLDYRQTAVKCTNRLETEESGKIVALTQGTLSCCKLFFKTFDKEFSSGLRYDTLTTNDQKMPDFYKMKDKHLAALETQRLELEKDNNWEAFLQILDHFQEQKKEWLYHSAEKGRDLDFAHGWRDCLRKHSDLCDTIKWTYERRTKERGKEPELFGDNELDLNTHDVDFIDLITEEDN